MAEDATTGLQSLPEYENPPINEIVCGVLFEPVQGFCASHFGILWNQFRTEFQKCEDLLPIHPPPADEITLLAKLLLPRVWFVEAEENRLIQVQRNRFLYTGLGLSKFNKFKLFKVNLNLFFLFSILFTQNYFL